MAFNPRVFFRRSHRWGAVLVAAPFLFVLLTGLLLQVKKQVPWVQPPMKKGQGREPTLSFAQILAAVQAVPEAQVGGWADIDRLDVRPQHGVVKVQCKNRYEVQVDTHSGEVLQVQYRRSDLIESLHDGSWFGEFAKLYVFFPAAVIVLGLWVTGMYLYLLPYMVKWRRTRPGHAPPPAPDA